MPKYAVYGVARGRVPGVYATWPEAHAQVSGFAGARFKGFMRTEDAEAFVQAASGCVGVVRTPSSSSSEDGSSQGSEDTGVFYAVVHAHSAPGNGVYRDWAVARGCRGAVRKFASRAEAQAFVDAQALAAGSAPPPLSAAAALERYGAGLQGAQRTCLARAVRRENVFFTGGAGTGKTFVLQRCVGALRAMGLSVGVTATTRLAGAGLGGVSLHAFAGVGLAQSRRDLQAARSRRDAVQRWTETDVLVVDEVSMLGPFLFDQLDALARALRGAPHAPFGGLQVVAVGDFYQLPPVARAPGSDPALAAEMAAYRGRTYCFEAAHWDECFPHAVVLDTVFRQRDDAFIAALNALRVGHVTPETQQFFEGCMIPDDDGDGDKNDHDNKSSSSQEMMSQLTQEEITEGETWTRLYPRNKDIDRHNSAMLAGLPEPEHVYEQTRFVEEGVSEALAAGAMDSTLYPRALRLRVGAPVVALVNKGDLYNGRQGRVTGFAAVPPAFLFADVTDPLVRAAPHFIALTEPFTRAPDTLYPVVRWDGAPAESAGGAVLPHIAEFHTGAGSAFLCQVPLKLAWALSIHKAQGMTLPHVQVALRAAFQPGQVYVALSRAVDKNGLRIRGHVDLRRIVHASPKVEAFYKRISGLSPSPPPPPPPPSSSPPLPPPTSQETTDI